MISWQLNWVEERLTELYRPDHGLSVEGFLIDARPSELIESARAGVVTYADSDGSFIGVYFNAETKARIARLPRDMHLVLSDLDTFCMLVEEVSHFHFLIDRMSKRLQASLAEIEYQAELDKVYLSTIAMWEAYGKLHMRELLTHLFGGKNLDESLPAHYKVADHRAGQKLFKWYERVQHMPSHLIIEALRRELRQSFTASWQQKMSA